MGASPPAPFLPHGRLDLPWQVALHCGLQGYLAQELKSAHSEDLRYRIPSILAYEEKTSGDVAKVWFPGRHRGTSLIRNAHPPRITSEVPMHSEDF